MYGKSRKNTLSLYRKSILKMITHKDMKQSSQNLRQCLQQLQTLQYSFIQKIRFTPPIYTTVNQRITA
jgi:hypothetical protein